MRSKMVVRFLLLTSLLAVAASADLLGRAAPHRVSDIVHHDRAYMFAQAEQLKESISSITPAQSMNLPSYERPKSREYHIIDYGADPTGVNDSSDAIEKAIADAFKAPPGGHILSKGIIDVSGSELHLDGGVFLISRPIALPSGGGGNFKIHSGSLRASDNFPGDRYLIEVWANHEPYNWQWDNQYEFITLSGLLLDSNFRGGGIAVVRAVRTTITDCYIAHFTTDGIYVAGGHETYISHTYIGQHITAGKDPDEKNFSGNGIHLDGNDNAVTDVAIFSAGTGILLTGAANFLTGVHCYNKATGFGGVGIYVKLPDKSQTFIANCYMDYTGIVVEDPQEIHIGGSFFLGGSYIVLKSVKGVAKGVTIVDNVFSGGLNDVVQLQGPAFTAIDQVYVERNTGGEGMRPKSTSAVAMVVGNGTQWVADFSGLLVFPNRIGNVQYSAMSTSGFPRMMMTSVSNNRVVINTHKKVNATVYVSVDQSVVRIM